MQAHSVGGGLAVVGGNVGAPGAPSQSSLSMPARTPAPFYSLPALARGCIFRGFFGSFVFIFL